MVFLLAGNTSFSVVDALGTSLLGIGIVFFVLIALLLMIRVLRNVIDRLEASKEKANDTAAVQAAPTAPEKRSASPAGNLVPAAGSMGEAKLHDVDDKTAAMIMAIVADTAGMPLNELRIRSLREKRSDTNKGSTASYAEIIEINKKYNFQIGKELSGDMKYNITLNSKVYEVDVERGEAALINVSDRVSQPSPAAVPAAPTAPASSAVTATATGETVNAPLPGTVLNILVNEGDTVTAGQVVIILEAMKMENEIVAPRDAKIIQIKVSKGATVDTGAVLMTLA